MTRDFVQSSENSKSRSEPLPLSHSWPLFEQPQHFELGLVLSSAVTDLVQPQNVGDLGVHHAGCWECELSDDTMIWSGGVFDIFGLPRNIPVTRPEALGHYSEPSRAAMERLRAYSIKHRRGFTIDAQILYSMLKTDQLDSKFANDAQAASACFKYSSSRQRVRSRCAPMSRGASAASRISRLRRRSSKASAHNCALLTSCVVIGSPSKVCGSYTAFR